MSGKFVVIEGIDGSGKTTIAKKAKEILGEGYMYNKGLKSDTLIGKIAGRFPSTLSFLAELAINTNYIIIPALDQNKTVIQDRYDWSVFTFRDPKWHDKLLIPIISKHLLKPDILVYLTVEIRERINRLKYRENNIYHEQLINNPQLIVEREERYQQLYNQFDGEKHIIDTTSKTIDETVQELINILLV